MSDVISHSKGIQNIGKFV